jgi:putative transposase
MRLEPGRRHLTVPVIGKLRSKENTRRLERLVVNGRARILSMTLSQRGGRLVVAVQAIVAQQPRHPGRAGRALRRRPWHRPRVGGHRPP